MPIMPVKEVIKRKSLILIQAIGRTFIRQAQTKLHWIGVICLVIHFEIWWDIQWYGSQHISWTFPVPEFINPIPQKNQTQKCTNFHFGWVLWDYITGFCHRHFYNKEALLWYH